MFKSNYQIIYQVIVIKVIRLQMTEIKNFKNCLEIRERREPSDGRGARGETNKNQIDLGFSDNTDKLCSFIKYKKGGYKYVRLW